MKPEKPPRHKGKAKPFCELSKATIEAIALAQAMELVDDITLLKMRAKGIVDLLNTYLNTENKENTP